MKGLGRVDQGVGQLKADLRIKVLSDGYNSSLLFWVCGRGGERTDSWRKTIF